MFKVFASIRAKLIGAFAVMLLLVCALGGVSLWAASQLGATAANFGTNIVPSVENASTLRGDIYNTRVSILSSLAATTPEDRAEQRQKFDERSALVTEEISRYGAYADTPEEKAMVEQLNTTWSDYVSRVPAILEMVAAGQQAQAYAINNQQLRPLANATADVAQQLADFNMAVATRAAEAAAALTTTVNILLLGGVAFAVLATLGFALAIIMTIAKGINAIVAPMSVLAGGDTSVDVPMRGNKTELGRIADAVEVFKLNMIQTEKLEADKLINQQRVESNAQMMAVLQSEIAEVITAGLDGDFSQRVKSTFTDPELTNLANGVNQLVQTVDGGLRETSSVLATIAKAELTERITGDYRGAFGQLKSDTNAVADRLTDIVIQLRSTSRSLKTATGEILSGANDLSERTTKQAAAIEETSAAIEQIAQIGKSNAEQAQRAEHQAGTAANLADEGGAVMQNANLAMERITASSNKISDIIGLIDDIAFQTNLLALNASVEAARAGDAGKGFAVVAVEVRRLAQSAASASGEIKQLIEQSAAEVTSGSRFVSDASTKLTAILDAVKQNNTLMKSIASASREQASAIGEVTTAVRQMDEMTQHNAALVEQTNAAIEQTEAQATQMDKVIEVFVVDDTRRDSQPAPAAPQRPAPAKAPAPREKTAAAARTYLTQGNAALAVQADWAEF